MKRSWIAGGLTVLVLAALLGSWFASGWSAVRAEKDAMRAAPRADAARRAVDLAAALDAHLRELAAREDARPWYQYRALYHDPRGAAEGNAVVPSPLSGQPDDPLVAAYFQIDAAGKVTLPGFDDKVPELASLDPAAAVALRSALGEVAPTLRGSEAVAMRPRVEVLDQNAYAQNMHASDVYNAQRNNDPEPLSKSLDPVTVTVAPLAWRALAIAGAPSVVAVRQVDTPDGMVTQGFLVRLDQARGFVQARAGDGPADLIAGASDDAAAPLLTGDGAWTVVVDDAAALHTADARADDLATSFLARFVPTAALATACAGLVVLLVVRAERAARQRASFAAAAAHELRTPLAGLQLYGDMLADGLGNPERARDYARRVSEEAARLGRVVSNVLDFSRLERGNLSVTPRSGDVARVVREAVDRARPSLERAGVDLVLEVPEALPARLDDDALARILGNLLDNAEKYGRGADDRTVTVRAARDGDAVAIEVHDAGPGVADAGALFRPFARGVGADGPPGLGLGLALSRSLARAMGGELDHRAGAGATFVVTLASRA